MAKLKRERASLWSEAMAKECVCPLLPALTEITATGSMGSTYYPRCVASECMAWRWAELHISEEAEVGLGYCGLAGMPPRSLLIVGGRHE